MNNVLRPLKQPNVICVISNKKFGKLQENVGKGVRRRWKNGDQPINICTDIRSCRRKEILNFQWPQYLLEANAWKLRVWWMWNMSEKWQPLRNFIHAMYKQQRLWMNSQVSIKHLKPAEMNTMYHEIYLLCVISKARLKKRNDYILSCFWPLDD